MYAVTYQAEELNLLPGVPHARIEFNGDLVLDARPDGSWSIDAIMINVATPAERFRTIHTLHPLDSDHPFYAPIVAAAEAHDRATQAISDHVRQQLEDADRAAASDYRFQLGRDIARGLEVA